MARDVQIFLDVNGLPKNGRYTDQKEKGDVYWYRDGKLHRDDGPAVTRSGGPPGTNVLEHWWFRDGKQHRDDGPAVERTDRSRAEFWRDGDPWPEGKQAWLRRVMEQERAKARKETCFTTGVKPQVKPMKLKPR